jgi:hypothetical protein
LAVHLSYFQVLEHLLTQNLPLLAKKRQNFFVTKMKIFKRLFRKQVINYLVIEDDKH